MPGRQIVEAVLAVGVGGVEQIAAVVDAVVVDIDEHVHAADAGFVRILHAVAIPVVPERVADGDDLLEAAVDGVVVCALGDGGGCV